MTHEEKRRNRAEHCRKRAKLHEQNRAKAKARKRALNQVNYAAAINAKEL